MPRTRTSYTQLPHTAAGGSSPRVLGAAVLTVFFALAGAFAAGPAIASTAYRRSEQFRCVQRHRNADCHGFEIELDDIHSTDITYTFDWNHYGAPTITEDNSDPAHPKVFVRYAAKFDAATSTFSAYTAVPATPPSPTDGHQCTNPTVNIGCEHFGVGHYGAPTVIRYNWLIENPAAPGTLIHGPAVNVATPSWTYYPPAPAQPVAQVQAVILAPPPPPAPVYEFGDAVWVKSIVTTSHNNQRGRAEGSGVRRPGRSHRQELGERRAGRGRDRMADHANGVQQSRRRKQRARRRQRRPAQRRRGRHPPLRVLQVRRTARSGDQRGDSATTIRRFRIPPTRRTRRNAIRPTVTVLGDYIGAQMAGFNVEAVLGMIDHVQDGNLDELYTTRTVVVGGNTPYVASVTSGSLPAGLDLDSATGVLSGTPTAAGEFSFTITATDADAVQVTKAYTMTIGDLGDLCPDDPAKSDPGLCGCGVPDTDSDGDGTPDCNDQCANDPNKTAARHLRLRRRRHG